MSRIHDLLFYPFVLWLIFNGLALHVSRLERVYRATCPAAFVLLLVRSITSPSLWEVFWTAGWFVAWWTGHRLICKHDHTKRLRDAATGLVERYGNRLRTVPVSS